MRSRLICSLVSAIVLGAGTASAEVTRIRLSIEDLPRQDEPLKIDAKNAMLPNGVHEGSPPPKSWREMKPTDDQMESGHCTDDRHGSVGTVYSGATSTKRIWEANGKTWLDSADVDLTFGSIRVSNAERVPLARVADGIWGFRRQNEVVLVAARDVGFMDHGSFYECRIQETSIDAKAGTGIVDSSPKDVNDVRKQVAQWMAEPNKPPKWQPAWIGVEFRALASVSKSSADPAAMLNVILRKP